MKFDLLVQIVGLIFAGLVQGISGFGVGLVAVGILISFYSPKIVIPSLLIVYVIVIFIHIYEHRRIITKEFLKSNPMFSPASIIMALFGLPIGTFILSYSNREQINFSLGVIILITSLYYLIREIRSQKLLTIEYSNPKIIKGKMACNLSSFFSGLLEGFLGVGGPPLVIYMLTKKYNKFFFIASFSLFFLILSPIRLIMYLSMGFYDLETMKFSGFISIFVVAGLLMGVLIRKRFISDKIFRKIIIIILILIGFNLLIKNI